AGTGGGDDRRAGPGQIAPDDRVPAPSAWPSADLSGRLLPGLSPGHALWAGARDLAAGLSPDGSGLPGDHGSQGAPAPGHGRGGAGGWGAIRAGPAGSAPGSRCPRPAGSTGRARPDHRPASTTGAPGGPPAAAGAGGGEPALV